MCPLLTGAVQEGPPNGMRETRLRTHAITGATVVVRPGEVIENATIIIRDGLIQRIGTDIELPRAARVWKADGRMIYPGLIDAAVLTSPGTIERGPYAHWNRHIHPEIEMAARPPFATSSRKSLREVGFTAAAIYPEDGIFRGTGMVVALDDDEERPAVYVDRAAMAAGFDRGGGYPSSEMGSIAAFRQAVLDARWHQQARRVWSQYPGAVEPPAESDALDALQDVANREQFLLFEVADEHQLLRADALMKELELDGLILASGFEFRRLDDVLATDRVLIVPVNFPKRPDVTTLDAADSTTLAEMLTWEQAATNPRRLIDAGATVALTTHGLDSKKDLASRIRRAISNGLTEDEALAALTTVPAELLSLSDVMGTIAPGKVANLVVASGPLFDRDTDILDVWINGERFEIKKDDPSLDYIGKGRLRVTEGRNEPFEADINIDTKKKTASLTLHSPTASEPDDAAETEAEDEAEEAKPIVIKAKQVTFDGRRLSFIIDGKEAFNTTGYVQFVATLSDGSFTGSGAMPDRKRFIFVIDPIGDNEAATTEADEKDTDGAEDADDAKDADEETDDDTDAESPDDPVSGTWSLTMSAAEMPGGEMPMVVELSLDDAGNVTGSIESELVNADISNGSFDESTGEIRFTVAGSGRTSQLVGRIENDAITGEVSGDGFAATINGTRAVGSDKKSAKAAKKAEENDVAPEGLVYPLGAYGREQAPQQEDVLIVNATIWTSGLEGIIDNGWMLVVDGKISAIGSGAVSGGNFQGRRIDAAGKHITPGLIDCHSHTGISGGVNEGSQAVTAEVSIGDVVDPDDVNWYRQLAGGLTAANQLHGSANPIGGRNSVVKLKWGSNAASFRVADAKPGIKFALGENVKRSQTRYPNTRMGVETVIRDSFTEARDYLNRWNEYESLSEAEQARTIPPQRDLELETLVEILQGDRLIHCHSYRQDEILMLLRVAEDFGFTIGTLQHILEGYKVADAIAAHGAGASSFSDWWAYKVEVMDAIPYNGAIMHDAGVVVSFNSDSSELARRMNTEAAKAVRYGGVAPDEALKFVTLNPAKQLRIDHRTGSLEPGKDADFVIWSGDPLSTYSRCEQTWIEGACYFSLEEDTQLREWVRAERERLIQKILAFEHGSLEEDDETPEKKSDPQ
ncbi:MAG: amidohydrolase family protein [Phycisphaerales bacterium]